MASDPPICFPSPSCQGHVYCCICGICAGTPLDADENDTPMWTNALRVLFRPWEVSGEAGRGKAQLTGIGTFVCGRVVDCCVIKAPLHSAANGDDPEWRTFRPFRSEDSFPIHDACWKVLVGLHPEYLSERNLERLLILFRRRERWPLGGWPRGLDFDYGGVESFWADAFERLPEPLLYMLAEPTLEPPTGGETREGLATELPASDHNRPIQTDALGTLFNILDLDILAMILERLDKTSFDRLPQLSRSIRVLLSGWNVYWRTAIKIHWPWMRLNTPKNIDGQNGLVYKDIFRAALASPDVANTHRIAGILRTHVEPEMEDRTN